MGRSNRGEITYSIRSIRKDGIGKVSLRLPYAGRSYYSSNVIDECKPDDLEHQLDLKSNEIQQEKWNYEQALSFLTLNRKIKIKAPDPALKLLFDPIDKVIEGNTLHRISVKLDSTERFKVNLNEVDKHFHFNHNEISFIRNALGIVEKKEGSIQWENLKDNIFYKRSKTLFVKVFMSILEEYGLERAKGDMIVLTDIIDDWETHHSRIKNLKGFVCSKF